MQGCATVPNVRKMIARSRRLLRDNSGVSMVEFALVLPVLLTLGLYGAEVANMATTKMKVSQIALTVADNASRLGQTDNSGITPTVTETDVDALLAGALQQGESIGLEAKGRVILTSLEFDDVTNGQFISWQRCIGDDATESAYGNDGDKNGINGPTITGMGSGTTQATAQSGSAVMFVEVFFTYESLFDTPFGSGDGVFNQEAAFLIRDDRNLAPGLSGTPSSECD